MDNAFWQSIIDNEYAVPAGYQIATLTTELLSYLGASDAQRREGPAYSILDAWIHQGCYSHAELWEVATQLLHNLTIDLGEQHNDSIFLRSFSILILAEIIHHDLSHPTLSQGELHHLLEHALTYCLAENDLRGYVYEKGWAHGIAHAADCLWVLAQHPFVTASDLTRIMNALAEKVTASVASVYLYDEDERMVRAVMAALQRDLLALPFLTTWLEHLTHPIGRIAWNETWESGKIMLIVQSEAETCARHNCKHFLRSLYFQLRSPGFANLTFVQQRPTVADELLALVEHALSQIRTWD